MKNKIKLLVFVFLFFIVFAIKENIYADTFEKLTYNVLEDGSIAIVDCDKSIENDYIIPEVIDGKEVKVIQNNAFGKCTNLESITIPKGVYSIGSFAFSGCNSLKNINVVESNVSFASKDGVLFSKDMKSIAKYPKAKEDSKYVVPDGVEEISYRAFDGSRNLKEIKFSSSLKKISDYAFYYCNNIENVEIPENVEKIAKWSFWSCSKLKAINVSQNNNNFSSEDGILFDKNKTMLIKFPDRNEKTQYTIPESVKKVEPYAFCYCSNIVNVTVPDSVTDLGKYTFYYCVNLENIKLSENISYVGECLFEGCSKLKNITIPKKVATIGENSFLNCNNLEYAVILGDITSIGNKAFYKCLNLNKILSFGNVGIIGTQVFDNTAEGFSFYAKNGLTGYEQNGWENYNNKIKRYDETLKNTNYNFDSLSQTGKIEISDVFNEISSIKDLEINNENIISINDDCIITPKVNGTTNVEVHINYFNGIEVIQNIKAIVDVKEKVDEPGDDNNNNDNDNDGNKVNDDESKQTIDNTKKESSNPTTGDILNIILPIIFVSSGAAMYTFFKLNKKSTTAK